MPLALVVAVGTAGTILAVSAAHRTQNAYADYLVRAEVGDVVVNPSTNTRQIAEVVRSLPGVERATSDAVFNATVDEPGTPRPRGEVGDLSTGSLFVRGSADGRYADMDRPTVRSGRLPIGRSEAVITQHTADTGVLAIGDEVQIAFWSPLPLIEGPPPERYDSEDAYLAEVVPPIGVERVEVVGIVTPSDEVLPDELYPRENLIVSPDIADRYDCLPDAPQPGATFASAVAALHPADCAVLYRFTSLSLARGSAGVEPALDEFVRAAASLNRGLADISDLEASGGEPPEYFLVATETDHERRRVERSIRPTVVGLLALAAAAAAVTAALTSLAVSREIRAARHDQHQWRQLGIVGPTRALLVGTPLIVAVLVGLVAGTLAGWLLDVGPLGLVRAVEPSPPRRLDAPALWAAMGIGALTTAIVIGTTAWFGPRLDSPTAGIAEGWTSRWLARRVTSPAVADGLRASAVQRTKPLVASGTLLTGAFVAAVVFGVGLSALVSTPRAYGWPWDLAAMAGSGYGDLDLEAAGRVLSDDPDVASWTALGFLNEISLEGAPLMSVVALDRSSRLQLPVIKGRLPAAADEVAIGTATASARGLAVGDTATLGGAIESTEVTVSGIVVFPTLGPILADRVSTGTGLLLPEALFDKQDLGYPAQGLAAFIGVDLTDGADTPATRRRVQRLLDGMDAVGVPTIPYPSPVRPPEIIDASSTRGVPLTVALVLAAVTSLGLAVSAWAAARARRRDLAALRALGFTRAQVRRSIQVQSTATMAVILAVGAPLGVASGRVLWRAFADQMGVLPGGGSLWAPTSVALAGGVVLGAFAALIPARLASTLRPGEVLRSE